jgi:hypothetical protein
MIVWLGIADHGWMNPMSTNVRAKIAASFRRRGYGMDEAMKAGIGASVCSVLILTILFVAMHLPLPSVGLG